MIDSERLKDDLVDMILEFDLVKSRIAALEAEVVSLRGTQHTQPKMCPTSDPNCSYASVKVQCTYNGDCLPCSPGTLRAGA
jgi:hypothetical protein